MKAILEMLEREYSYCPRKRFSMILSVIFAAAGTFLIIIGSDARFMVGIPFCLMSGALFKEGFLESVLKYFRNIRTRKYRSKWQMENDITFHLENIMDTIDRDSNPQADVKMLLKEAKKYLAWVSFQKGYNYLNEKFSKEAKKRGWVHPPTLYTDNFSCPETLGLNTGKSPKQPLGTKTIRLV
jgi:hypothetical protein